MILRAMSWLAEEAWEKINVVATWRELKELGRKHGRRFFIMGVTWEIIEDVVFPFLSYWAGYPQLIPVFLVLHFEPIVYPVFFWCFRMWDRIHGRIPWDPDRLAASSYWRTGLKMLSYRLVAFVVFGLLLAKLNLPLGILSVYVVTMTFFGFVHDRLWHDSNFGIDVPTDTVKPIRVITKACTYRIVSTLAMAGVFAGVLGYVPHEAWCYQALMFPLHLAIGWWWAKSPLGIHPVQSDTAPS
jgi:hypothetical protein